MSPWPEALTQSPMISPIPQSPDDKDPFAVTYGSAAPGIPQFNQFNQQQVTQVPVQHQQPFQMMHQQQMQQPYQMQQQQLTQQPQQVDPWASMLATPPAAPSSFNEAPKQMTPPPSMVMYDALQQNDPPSPMGDVSVLAAAFGNVNGATQPLQQLQPMTQPTIMEQMMPSTAPAIAPANPFDFDVVATSIPNCSPPKMMPPVPPPTPPRDVNQQMHHLQQQQHQTQLPMTFAPPAEPFGFNQQLAPQAAQFNGDVFEQQQQQQQQQQYAVNHGVMVPAATRAMSPYGFSPNQGMHNDPFGYAFSPMASPVPQSSPGNGNNMLAHDPFATSPPLYSPTDSGAMVVSNAANEDPFGVFGGNNATAMVPSSPTCHDPYNVMGGSMTSSFGGSGTMVTASSGGDSDPFGGMFGALTTPVAATVTQDAGLGIAQSHPHHRAGSIAGFDPRLEHPPNEKDISLDTNGLPSDGEYYEARINARSLGAMFYTARNLEETLFLKVPNNVIEAFGQRPVVAYVAEESAAYNAGVLLGHIVMEVNGEAVSNPEMCATAIRNAPRPLVLRCFAPPDLELTCSEGHHRVKYDVNNLDAPATSMEWKTKYVLVGGIVTKPWMMSMFYKKSDYDIAVKEAHAGQQISVKVKQFDLRGARVVLKGMDGMPNRVNYSDQGKPWYWISIVPNKGYPIKISSESPEGLEPIYAAVRRFVKKDMEARYTSKMSESFESMRTRRY